MKDRNDKHTDMDQKIKHTWTWMNTYTITSMK